MEDNRDGTYKVYFRVDKPGEYVLDIKFGGETIPEGRYTFTVSTDYRYRAAFAYRLRLLIALGVMGLEDVRMLEGC